MLFQRAVFHSFLWLCSIPYYLLCLFINGHLPCFHTLTIINNDTMNIGVHISFLISVFIFFSKCHETAGSYGMIVLFLIFWGNSILLFTVATSIYSPISNVRRFPFFTSSPMSVTCLFNNVFPCSYHEIHIQQMSYISRNLFQVGSNLNLNSF